MNNGGWSSVVLFNSTPKLRKNPLRMFYIGKFYMHGKNIKESKLVICNIKFKSQTDDCCWVMPRYLTF